MRNDLARDHRIVTFDVRGHGYSERGAASLSVPLVAEDAKQLLDILDIGEAYVCGYSVGAMPALEAMLAYPGRFRGGILLSGASELTDRRSRLAMQAAALASRLRAKEATVLPIALGNADSRATFRILHREGAAGDARRHREYIAACLAYSCTGRLRAIDAPVLLACGGKDPTFIRYAEGMNERLKAAELHIVPGARHQLPTKAPDETAGAIRAWIARQEGRAAAAPRPFRQADAPEWTEAQDEPAADRPDGAPRSTV